MARSRKPTSLNSAHTMNAKPFLQLLAAIIALLSNILTTRAAEPQKPSDDQPAIEFADTRERLITLSQTKALTVSEQFELTVSLFGSGKFGEALLVGRMGLGLTQVAREKSLFYMMIAQCNGALGNYHAAAEAALAGQRLHPLSSELAALRFAYFTKVEDKAQAQAAADTLAQIVPGGGQDERPIVSIQGGIWLVKMVVRSIQAGMAAYEVGKRAWPEIEPHFKVIAKTVMTLWREPVSARGLTPPIK